MKVKESSFYQEEGKVAENIVVIGIHILFCRQGKVGTNREN